MEMEEDIIKVLMEEEIVQVALLDIMVIEDHLVAGFVEEYEVATIEVDVAVIDLNSNLSLR